MIDSGQASGPTTADAGGVWTRRFWFWFLVVVGVRVAFALLFPLDFAEDEAYYWDWGRRLDWGYFSKPPMVAWLMALGGWLGDDIYQVFKLIPVVLTAAGTLALYGLTRRIYGERAAFWSGTLLMATPAAAVLSILLTIDPPLFFFWNLSLYFAWRWLEPGAPRATASGPLWIPVALTFSLGGGYLSKPIQLLFPVLLLLFIALNPGERWRLRRPGIYLVLLGSLAFLAPVVWWNHQHGWITLSHTAQHFEPPDLRWGKMISRPFEFIGSQLGLCSPVVWWLLASILVALTRAWRRLGPAERYLFCFSGPALAVVYLMSFWQRVHPNWPLVFYISGFALLGGLAAGKLDALPTLRRRRGWHAPGLAVAIALSALAYAATFAIGLTPWGGTKLDPTERVRGWSELGQAVGDVLAQMPDPKRTLLLTSSRRQLASQLAYYTPGRPRVYRLENPARPTSQYGIWGGPGPEKKGWDALIVIEGDTNQGLPPMLEKAFASTRSLETLRIPLGASGRARTVQLWLATDFRAWPYPTNEEQ